LVPYPPYHSNWVQRHEDFRILLLSKTQAPLLQRNDNGIE